MGNTHGPGTVMSGCCLFQIGNLSYGFIDVKFSGLVQNRDTGRIIAAVFQPVKALYKYRICLPAS
jgi:hypothetical protein